MAIEESLSDSKLLANDSISSVTTLGNHSIVSGSDVINFIKKPQSQQSFSCSSISVSANDNIEIATSSQATQPTSTNSIPITICVSPKEIDETAEAPVVMQPPKKRGGWFERAKILEVSSDLTDFM